MSFVVHEPLVFFTLISLNCDNPFTVAYVLFQDNDSKHKSKSTKKWMEENGVLENVMETPASSPDINPIEMVWSSMKQYLQRVVKPRVKKELIDGIRAFWETLTPQKCGRYIDNVHKVLPVVVLNSGGPTDA